MIMVRTISGRWSFVDKEGKEVLNLLYEKEYLLLNDKGLVQKYTQ